FASSFLQIPRHHGHPCSWLTSTSVFGVRDLHPIVHVHAGRTYEKIDSLPAVDFFSPSTKSK
ncbi:hypothetical protein, partial [Bacillus smithii]|uniref:hypothetical protein n=1 Tax=Bacillus smithii TaxID=1479 RepID=UPI002E1D9ECE|nr:hypothetical protein [Bacillus smithii]